jgi:hypothetical protein
MEFRPLPNVHWAARERFALIEINFASTVP